MATLEAEHAAAMRALTGGVGGGVPWWMAGAQSGSGFAGSASPVAPPYFDEKRKVAKAEVKGLVKAMVDRAAKSDLQERTAEQAAVNDYLPAIACLLRDSLAAQQAESAARPPAGDGDFLPLAIWTKQSGQAVRDGVPVFGFIEPADHALYRFVDEREAELKVEDYRDFLTSSRDRVVDDEGGGGSDAVTVALSSQLASGFQAGIARFLKEVRAARDHRKAADAVSTNPTAAYRWIFGQLVDKSTAKYVPFMQVCPLAPRIRIAVCGTAKLDGDERMIESTRLLITTTPLASQGSFIRENNGVPAVLVDEDGVHDTTFIECPLFCKDRDKWLRGRPAVKRVSGEPDAYVRSMLVAPPGDIEKMNKQLREEIRSATSAALEASLSQASVARGLKAAGVDKKSLDAKTRVFTNGVGRKIVDGLVALASGQAVPGEAIPSLAGDRKRFSKLAREPQLGAFIDKEFIDSFLILAIDQEGVSLCDFRALLGVHQQYAMMSSGQSGEDHIETACRFAEIATWLQVVGSGEPVPFNPPFRKIPETVESRKKLLDDLQANLAIQDAPGSASEKKEEDVELRAGEDSDFKFPGS